MDAQHVTIYREPGRFAGWPANYGLWAWGNEVVVGFTVGYLKAGARFHACDRDRPFVGMQARSVDGGRTWQAQPTPCRVPGNRGMSADEHVNPRLAIGQPDGLDNAPVPFQGRIHFTHPEFALMCARTGLAAGAVSWFYYSYDRCRTWEGPFALPTFGLPGVAARTDYLVAGADECTLFLTAAKSDGEEGRVFCARTTDGGRTFRFRSWIGPEPEGFAIMPASARLSDARWLTAVRCCRRPPGGREESWIDLYASDDGGATWAYLSTPVAHLGPAGNPPALIRLHDGRLCLAYGNRAAPCGIHARLSDDGGATWSDPIVLRGGAGNHDIGYPRIAQRPDGVIMVAYYFNDGPGSERYIAATLWKP